MPSTRRDSPKALRAGRSRSEVDAMRLVLATVCAVFVTGCESFSEKVDASRQDRCQRADWAQVGERDGVEGAAQAERYAHICGDLFQPDAYRQGVQKGAARRPRPPV